MKITTKPYLALLALGLTISGYSQSSGLSNIQEFTPSKLLRKGQVDIKLFGSLFTTTRSADINGDISKIDRQTFLTNTNEIFIGVSKERRINLGVIWQARSNSLGGQGALEVFKLDDTHSNGGFRSGLTTIAPAIRVQPLRKVPNFSFTTAFYFPVFEDIPGGFLDARSHIWETRFFYDRTFGGNKWQIFAEIDYRFFFGEEQDEVDLETDQNGNFTTDDDGNFIPTENTSERFANNGVDVIYSAFLSYFPSSKFTVFVNAQQFFFIDLGSDFEREFTLVGGGAKYQLTKAINLEASFGYFARGENTPLGESYNLGARFLLF